MGQWFERNDVEYAQIPISSSMKTTSMHPCIMELDSLEDCE
jgi:hypothetical protein